mgnify:CR=1 FL=1
MNKAELVRLQEIEAEQKLRLEGVSKRNETAAQIALDNTQTEIKLLEEKIRLQEEEARKRKENQANILLESEELQEQMKVIEQFDRTTSVREVKLVYSTFAESIKRKSVNESAKRVSKASKPVASTGSKKPIIGENTDFKSRMKKLANII